MNSLPCLAAALLLAHASAFAHEQHTPSTHATSAAGRAGVPDQVSRTLDVGMYDSMRYAPEDITLRRGDTVRLVARNAGQVLHEIVLGTSDEIRLLRQALQRDPAMMHAAPFMLHVAPGERGEIVWQFDRAGRFEFACLLPGHYEAGMKGTIAVR
jgi:uncharacterized cupredoxin-like copper-binding protein